MDNVMFHHMCNVALSSTYNGICAAFLQTHLKSLPQGVLYKYGVVNWRGEVENVQEFWTKVPYLFELQLQRGSSIYVSLEPFERANFGVDGEDQSGELFYSAYNNEVEAPEWLSRQLSARQNLLRFVRSMRARIHRRVKKLRQDFEDAQPRYRQLAEDLADIRKEVEELVRVANQHRGDNPVFDIDHWISKMQNRAYSLATAASDTPVPMGRRQTYIRNTMLARRKIRDELVGKLDSFNSQEVELERVKLKLPRMENYLYFTTIAVRLLRDEDIAKVLEDPESHIRQRFIALGNASAHPVMYRPRLRATINRLCRRDDLTQGE